MSQSNLPSGFCEEDILYFSLSEHMAAMDMVLNYLSAPETQSL
jgi:hypothetical protein